MMALVAVQLRISSILAMVALVALMAMVAVVAGSGGPRLSRSPLVRLPCTISAWMNPAHPSLDHLSNSPFSI